MINSIKLGIEQRVFKLKFVYKLAQKDAQEGKPKRSGYEYMGAATLAWCCHLEETGRTLLIGDDQQELLDYYGNLNSKSKSDVKKDVDAMLSMLSSKKSKKSSVKLSK